MLRCAKGSFREVCDLIGGVRGLLWEDSGCGPGADGEHTGTFARLKHVRRGLYRVRRDQGLVLVEGSLLPPGCEITG